MHSHQIVRNAELLIRLADDAEKIGNENLALSYLGHYIRLRKNDLDGLKRYASLVAKNTDSVRAQQAALLAIEEILRMDENADDFRRQAANIAIEMRRFQDASAHVKRLRERHKQDAELEYMQGQCYNGMGEYQNAATAMLRAIELDKTKIDYYFDLVEVVKIRSESLKLQEIDPIHEADTTADAVADRLIEQMVENGQPKYEAYLSRARYRMGNQELIKAQEDVDQALKLAGHEPDVLLLGIELAITRAGEASSLGNEEESKSLLIGARELAKTGMGLSDANMRFYVLLAEIERGEGDQVKALKIVQDGIRELEKRQLLNGVNDLNELGEAERQLLFMHADLTILQARLPDGSRDMSKLAAARDVIAKLRETLIKKALIDFLEARILLTDEKWNEASLILERARRDLDRFPVVMQRIDLLLANCYQQLDNPDAVLFVYERALKSYPLWVPARLGYAGALALVNRIDESIAIYAHMINYPGVQQIVAELLIVRQASLPTSKRDWSAVGNYLTAIGKNSKSEVDSAKIAVIKTQYLFQQDQFAEAFKTLEEAKEKYPDDISVWTSLVRLTAYRSDFEVSERTSLSRQILRQAVDKFGDRAELRMTEIGLIARPDNKQALEQLQPLEKGLENFSEEEQLQLLEGLASAYQRIGARDKVEPLIRRMAEIRPREIQYRLRLVEFVGKQGDDQAVVENLKAIREVEGPGGPCGNYVEASRLIHQATRDRKLGDNLKKARELLAETAKKRPTWADVARTQGILEELVGNYDEAFDYYQRAIALGDRSQSSILRIIQFLYEKQRYEEADQELRNLVEEDPTLLSGELARLGWRIAWERQQFDQALGLAVNVANDTANYRDHIWVSQLRQARGMPSAEVEQPLRDAIKLAPDAPEVWLTLIGFLVREKRLEEAGVAIEQARTALPQSVLHDTLGRCYELVEKYELAEEQYRQSVAEEPKNVARLIRVCDFFSRIGKTGASDEYLKRIVDPATEAPDFAIAWARRRQALQIASTRRFDDTEKALQMLQSSVNERKIETISDLRVRVSILTNSLSRKDQLDAIATYEKIGAAVPLMESERFRLARLYMVTGNWPRCRDLSQEMISNNQDNLLLLIFHTSNLIAMNDTLEAEIWLRQVEAKIPDALLTHKLRAQLLAVNGQTKDAADLLVEFFRQSNFDTNQKVLTSLIENGDAAGVTQFLGKYIDEQKETRTQAVLDEAVTLLEEGKTDEATKKLAGFLELAQVILQLQIDGLKSTASLLADFEQFDAADQLYREYITRSELPEAKLEYAIFLANRERVADALAICNELWGKAPDDAVARTSMAIVESTTRQPKIEQMVEQRLLDSIRENPRMSWQKLALARLRELQNRYPDACAQYRDVISLEPQNIWALNNLAYALALLGQDLDEAMNSIQSVIRLAGPVPEFLDTRALVYLAREETKKAIDDLSTAVNSNANPIFLFHLAEAHLKNNDPNKAQEALERAKSSGLTADQLNPLEKDRYRQLEAALAKVASR
ncbi:MAG: tetratricopeptide repeat protein [Planctomycetaceae bacterium]